MIAVVELRSGRRLGGDMPARTNDFQRLVKRIQETFLPIGATITESAMVSAPGCGTMREIDVLVEIPAGPYRLKIAVEAKHQKRKMDVSAIETLIGRYRAGAALIVDRVVFVSSSGFSNAAKEKAKANGIQLLTLREAEAANWDQIFPGSERPLPESLNIAIPPRISNARFTACHTMSQADADGMRVACRCCGKVFESLGQFMQLKIFPSESFKKWLEADTVSRKRAMKCSLNGVYGVLRDGSQIDLIDLSIDIEFRGGIVPLKFKSFELAEDGVQAKVVHQGSGELRGAKIEFTVGPEAIVFDLGNLNEWLPPELAGPIVLRRAKP